MNYYYLMASLPMLTLETELATSSTQFLSLCQDTLSEQQFELLQAVTLVPGVPSCCAIDSKWQAYETSLRNCVSHRVAHKSKADVTAYLREERDAYMDLEKQVEDAFDSPNPLKTEQALDQLRWVELENLATGHDFDFEALFLYRVKLLIMEKSSSLTKALGQEKVDKTVAQILENSNSALTTV